MPSLLETASELNKMLTTALTGVLPIAAENIPYTEAVGTDYVEVDFLPYTSVNVNIGAASTKRIRSEGVLNIIIRSGIGKGIGTAYGYIETIQTAMENKNPVANLFTYTADVRRVGEGSDGWYTIIVDIPFISDDI